ncbi:MAG: hypothetical protein MZV64_69985 [Ignavibacteriales bacterium]|nr:hypothetical protein [Ignavibacteriales bacterium]
MKTGSMVGYHRFSLEHQTGLYFLVQSFVNIIHFTGGVLNYAENLPPGVTKNYRYYSYEGEKDIFSAFVNESYRLNEQWNLLGELQAGLS